jgi:hypothetical protein
MVTARLEVTRSQILAFRRAVASLDERLAPGSRALRRAAWAGLQDSMPRAALLSIHARVRDTGPDAWEDPSLVQVWGPRYSAYVVAERDRAVFTLGRLPQDAAGRRRAEDVAARLDEAVAGGAMAYRDAGEALGMHPNALRYAAPTGTVLIRWAGGGAPTVWTVPAPDVDPAEARVELARRYLHVFGPSTAEAFGQWAGVRAPRAVAAFEALEGSLLPVRTPIGPAWLLASDEPAIRAEPQPPAPVRLLPSGDAYYLLQGDDRELLVPDAHCRDQLWTPRVWPGALLVEGEVVGTWRRSKGTVTIAPWRRLTDRQRDAVTAEAEGLPLPGVGALSVRWTA